MDKKWARQARMRRMIVMKNNSSKRKTSSINVDENTALLHMDPLRMPLNYNEEAMKHTISRHANPMRSPLGSLDSVQNIIAEDSATQQSSLSNIQTMTAYQKTRKRKDPCSEVSPLSVLNTNIQIPSPRVNNVGCFPGPIGQTNNVSATYKTQAASYARLRRKAIMKNKSKMNYRWGILHDDKQWTWMFAA